MSEAQPVPEHLTRATASWARYKRMLRRLALAMLAMLTLTMLYFKLVGEPLPARPVIATLAAIGLLTMLGTGLLGIVLLKRRGEETAR